VHRDSVRRHGALRANVTVKRSAGGRAVDQLDRANLDEAMTVQRVEPAPQIGLQLAACRERGHRSARGSHQMSLVPFISLQGSNAGNSWPVAQ
jgi:hypothetical protein